MITVGLGGAPPSLARVSSKMERSEALARDKPGMYQHQREVENNISITMQSYTHVGWRHNGPGVTGAPL